MEVAPAASGARGAHQSVDESSNKRPAPPPQQVASPESSPNADAPMPSAKQAKQASPDADTHLALAALWLVWTRCSRPGQAAKSEPWKQV